MTTVYPGCPPQGTIINNSLAGWRHMWWFTSGEGWEWRSEEGPTYQILRASPRSRGWIVSRSCFPDEPWSYVASFKTREAAADGARKHLVTTPNERTD